MADYPVGLKYQPDLSAFRILEGNPPPEVTEFEDGPMLMRRKMLNERAKLAYRIMFRTHPELHTFRTFVRDTLGHGGARFNMPVWTPTTATYPVRSVQLEGGRYTAEPWGLGWQVSFNLFVYDW
jgi:hypothetical protein